MKIALVSDLHLDHYSSGVRGFVESLEALARAGELEQAGVAVVAGDVADGRFPDQYRCLLRGLREHYPAVVVVAGNHDYYKSTLAQTHRSFELACADVPGSHFLHRSSVEIGGVTLHGHPMWYRDGELNAVYEGWMNDVQYIGDFKKWVYEEQGLFEHYLRGNLAPGDVVVTHHLPSEKSVARRYKGGDLNRFFVCDMEWLIQERQPALWLHGHTHVPCDYKIGETRVVCNPRGYPRESAFGPVGYKPLVVEFNEKG